MKATHVGLLAGLLVGLVAVVGGFWATLGVLCFGAVGLVLGAFVESGRLDLVELLRGGRSRR